MADEITLIKQHDGSLRPATTYDSELLSKYRLGDPVKAVVKKVKPRSLQHHKLFFGGLLGLVMDYWEPGNDFISPGERRTLERFADWLDSKGGNSGAIRRAAEVFFDQTNKSRSRSVEAPNVSINSLLSWVKINVNHVDIERRPDGIHKVPRSINFNAIGQDEFNEFYKAAFSVCWKFVLSKSFENEDDAQKAIDRLMGMGQ